MYETGGMRRTHLRKRNNILKRLLFHAIGFNLALLLRECYGIGKPRTRQGTSDVILLVRIAWTAFFAAWMESRESNEPVFESLSISDNPPAGETFQTSNTGC
jgi:hypothetical protein